MGSQVYRVTVATLLALAALVTLTAGCDDDEATTRLVLVINSDLRAGEELRRVRVQITKVDGTGRSLDTSYAIVEDEPKAGQVRLPLELAIDRDNADRFLVQVTGYGTLGDGRAERKLVEQRATATFQEGSTRALTIFLGEVCVDIFCDGNEELVCYPEPNDAIAAGECGEVQESTLHEWSSEDTESDDGVDGGTDGGAERDGGADSGSRAPVDGGIDAGTNADTQMVIDPATDAGMDAGMQMVIDPATDAGMDAGMQMVIDPCDVDRGGCDAMASCESSTGVAQCTCPSGTLDTRGDGSLCELIHCGELATTAPLMVSTEATDLGGVATYSCATGYDLSGSLTRVCGETGLWSASAPACIPVNCGSPEAPAAHGSVNAPDGTTFGLLAQYDCDADYGLVGASSSACEADAQWGEATPACLRDCGAVPGAPDNGAVSVQSAGSLEGATTSYSCSTGYRIDGDASASCQASGAWSGTRSCDDYDACSAANICSADYPCQDRPAPSESYQCRGQFAEWTPSDSPSSFVVNGGGTVNDTRTGLVWQRAVDADSYTWDAAKSYCAGLSLAGGGWHLPTKAQLESIVDLSVFDPAIDTDTFPDTPNEWFWASSAYVGSFGNAWVVDFLYGYSNNGSTGSNTHRARCVR